jgi:cysteine desulfurase/selenocysteine lyase
MLPFAVLYAMGASLEMILEIGPEAIEKRVLELADGVREIARELGGEPVSVNSPIVSVRFDGRDPSPLALALKEKRVLVAARHGLLRISTHFYNNEEDLERLREGLAAVL